MFLERCALRPLAAALGGVALVLAGGCYDSGDYSPTAVNVDAILTLSSVTGATSLPADGFSRLRLEARLLGAPAADRRTVLFRVNGPGTLQGGVADGNDRAVEADANGRASIDFVAGQTPGTAVVTATPKAAAGVTVSLPLTLLPPDPNEVVRFVAAPGRAPADGATLTPFTVEVSPTLPAGSTVQFAASASGFGSAAAPTLSVPVDAGRRASADLKSPATISTARVTATVQGVTRAAEITFERALPGAITVAADRLTAPAALDTELTITATLHRDVGSVTDDTAVTFRAEDDAGAAVGLFGNVTRSSGGTATATFRPRSETPGFVTVTVGTEGTSVTGSLRIELTAP